MKRAAVFAYAFIVMLFFSGCENISDVKKDPAAFPQMYSGALEVESDGQIYTFAVNNNEKGSYIEVLSPKELSGLAYELPYTGEIVITYNDLSFSEGINMLDSSSTVMRLHSVLQQPHRLQAIDDTSYTDGTITVRLISSDETSQAE